MTVLPPDVPRLPRIVAVGRKLLEQPFSPALYAEAADALDCMCSIDEDTAPLLRALAHAADVEKDGILGGGEVRRYLGQLSAHLRAAANSAGCVMSARKRQAEHADWQPGTAAMVQGAEQWGGWDREAAE